MCHLSSTLYMYIEFALWECIQNFRRFGYSVYLCEKVKLLFDNCPFPTRCPTITLTFTSGVTYLLPVWRTRDCNRTTSLFRLSDSSSLRSCSQWWPTSCLIYTDNSYFNYTCIPYTALKHTKQPPPPKKKSYQRQFNKIQN